ncbi:MAG: serine--tRNA ligase [bacterium]
MLDIKYIRKNPKKIKQAAEQKNIQINIDRLLSIDRTCINLRKEIEDLRSEQNKYKKKPSKTELVKLKKIAIKVNQQQKKLRELQKEMTELMLLVPNIPDSKAPVGADQRSNQLVKTWGNPIRFSFKPKSHIDLGLKLDIVDFVRGVKIGGFRSYFLKNEGALLDLAITRYAIDFMIARGFTIMAPPIINLQKYFYGTGFLPWFKEEIFELSKQKDQALIGTSEVPLVSYYAEEVLSIDDLPVKLAGYSPCFRTEIGSYGKETKGLYRVRQFNKVEQVVLCKNDYSESMRWLEEIQKNAEDFIQSLGLPYRVMEMCTGEMGVSKVKMFDLETWMPSFNHYRETHSASNLGDFQSRRLNIRYKDKDRKIQYVHTLNNTVIATPRILIPLLENHQQGDGSVRIPEVLHKYTGFKSIEPKRK